jgi:DNA-binding response OmpR family regulator
VIVCSAAVDDLHEHQPVLDKYGVRALPKPFDLDDLLAAVRTAFQDAPRKQRPDL